MPPVLRLKPSKHTPADQRWDAPVIVGSGLGSGRIERWQKPLYELSLEIGNAFFHPSHEDNTGYEGWESCVIRALESGRKVLPMIGHSNFGYFMTKVATTLEPFGIDCPICDFDRTLKRCPTVGANVSELINLHASLRYVTPNERFAGERHIYEFRNVSHIGIISHKPARKIAIDFGKRWRKKQ